MRRAFLLIAAAFAAALALVAYPLYRQLQEKTGIIETDSLVAVSDAGPKLGGLITVFPKVMAQWLPWWPITLGLVVAALTLPAVRQRLLGWWAWWGLVAAPAGFVLAFHVLVRAEAEELVYQPRYAYFWLVPLTCAAAALAAAAAQHRLPSQRLRPAVIALLGAALIGQLPGTARVLTYKEAADWAVVATVLSTQVPDDAIVLYDNATPAGRWRQSFHARPRYMGDRPRISFVRGVAKRPGTVPRRGLVRVLLLDSSREVPGWRATRLDRRFTLYEPVADRRGREGALRACLAFGDALGPDVGYAMTLAAASLLEQLDRPQEASRALSAMFAAAEPDVEERIRGEIASHDLRPALP